MKSIKFNVPGIMDKIFSGEKTLTLRSLYIPRLVEGDDVNLIEIIGKWKDKKKARTCLSTINSVFPIRVMDITDEVAIKEGFKNRKESIDFLKETYKGLRDENWIFGIEWGKITRSKTLNEIGKNGNTR